MSRARDMEPRLRTAFKPFKGVQLSNGKTTKPKSKPAKAKTVTSKSKSVAKPRTTIKKAVIKTKVCQCQGSRYRGTVGIVGCAEVLWGTGPWLGYVVNMVINKNKYKMNARLN